MHRSTKRGAWCSICDKIEDKLLGSFRQERKEEKKRAQYGLDRSVFRNLSTRTCIFFSNLRIAVWMAMAQSSTIFRYLLCAISIDIVAFCPRTPSFTETK